MTAGLVGSAMLAFVKVMPTVIAPPVGAPAVNSPPAESVQVAVSAIWLFPEHQGGQVKIRYVNDTSATERKSYG